MGTITRSIIEKLSSSQRSLLILHIDQAVDVRRDDAMKIHTTLSLIRLGLLCSAANGPVSARPKQTVLSAAGRQAVAILLGDYADALIRAGCMEPEPLTPLMILQRLKAKRNPAVSAETALKPAIDALSRLEK